MRRLIDSTIGRCACALVLVMSTQTLGGTVSWDGGGDGTSWMDPLNWSGDTLPAAGDDVMIPPGGAGFVELAGFGTTSINSLECARSLHLEQQSTLEIAASSTITGELEIAGGTLMVPSALAVESFVFAGGTINGDGTLTVANGAAISGPSLMFVDVVLLLEGASTWDGGQIRVSGVNQIVVAPGATLDVETDAVLWWQSGSPGTLSVQGTLRKTAGAITDVRVPVELAAGGTIEIAQDLAMLFSQGGAYAGSIEGPGSLELTGLLHDFAAGSSLLCGSVRNAAPVDLHGLVDVESTRIESGTLHIRPGASIVSLGEPVEMVNGTFDDTSGDVLQIETLAWSSGTIIGNSEMTVVDVETGAGGALKFLHRDLRVTGTFDWAGGQIRVSEPSSLIIDTDGTLDVHGDFTLWWQTVGPGTLVNNGTVRKASGSSSLNIWVDAAGSGEWLVETGTLVMSEEANIAGAISGESLQLTGFHLNKVFGSSSQITTSLLEIESQVLLQGTTSPDALVIGNNANAEFVSGSEVVIASWLQTGGIVGGPDTIRVTGDFEWRQGTINGPGQLLLEGPSLFTTASLKLTDRDIDIAGTATWDGGGLRVSEPATLRVLPGGTLDIESEQALWWQVGAPGTLVNQGMVRRMGLGTTPVRIPVLNNGELHVESGTLRIEEPLLNLDKGTLQNGTYRVEGTLEVMDAAVETLDATLSLEGPDALFTDLVFSSALEPLAMITDDGVLAVTNGATTTTNSALEVHGTVAVGSGSTLDTGGDVVQLDGSIRVDGTLTPGGGVVDVLGGGLFGNGVVAGELHNAAAVGVGASAGSLTVLADYVQETEGVLFIELGGAEPVVEHDLLQVGGDAQLGGTLVLTLIDGYLPPLTQQFTILETDPGDVLDFFEFVDCADLYLVGYEDDFVTVEVVSEPKTGDVNCDGVVDVLDLVALILVWGECPAPPVTCPADIDGNGVVDVSDLVLVIVNWG